MSSPIVDRPLRVAILTDCVSHFEIPLYRIIAKLPGIDSRIFYIQPYQDGDVYDSQYKQKITWGVPLEGLTAQKFDQLEGLISEYASWKADVALVNGYGWPGVSKILRLNKRLGTPQIFRGTLSPHHDVRRIPWCYLTRFKRRHLLKMFDVYHYGGDYSRKVLLDAGVPAERLFFVPYSVDSSHFLDHRAEAALLRERVRKSIGWDAGTFVVLWIGQHSWFKGPDIALKAFGQFYDRHPEARLLLVGSGQMTGQLLKTAQNHLPPGVCHYAGFVPSSETVAYYFASDVALFTSRYETWARAVNEAMLCGVPCIINTNIPAAGGLVADGMNGYVVKSQRPADYARALSLYLNRAPERKEEIKRNAQDRAEYFCYERHTEELMKSILSAKTCRPSVRS